MKRIDFYFDPVSPYAALAFERLPEALAGHSVVVRHVPILFGALLKAMSHKGPADIPAKRDWTYRHVQWLGHQLGIPLQMPAAHPFNPLPLLRLLWACAEPGQTPSRYAVEQVFQHVWLGGADALDPVRLQALTDRLAPAQDPTSDAVKAALRQATDEAQQLGIFGVPTVALDGKLFWGLDALDMVSACLRGDAWFDGPGWLAAGGIPNGLAGR